jgi:hypothetical protein
MNAIYIFIVSIVANLGDIYELIVLKIEHWSFKVYAVNSKHLVKYAS